MDRNKRTILEIIVILAMFLILSMIAYFAGTGLAKTFLKAGGVTLGQWKDHYIALVRTMGLVSCCITFVWYFSARFFLKITYPVFVGKRTIWVVIGLLNLVSCMVVPFFYVRSDSILKIDVTIYILFLVLFGILGYYASSIIATPACYKYTPIGAKSIRAAKYKKRSLKE